MKPVNFTRPQTASMLQNLRARKLQLDRAICELEAYAALNGHIPVPAEQPRRLYLVPTDDMQEQWLQ